jgi:hypothetical protein
MLHKTAIALAKRGVAVLPLVPRDKRPANNNGVLGATADLTIVGQWWAERPDFNVGVACGHSFFVLDIDGEDAEAALRKLEAEWGDLPPTTECITSRGRHIYFKMAAGVANSNGKLAPGIEVKSTGTYVVVPPSIHPSGRTYSWSVDSTGELADAPAWLLRLIAAPKTNGFNGQASDWAKVLKAGADEGARDVTATKIAGWLLRHHLPPCAVIELLHLWNNDRCRPPLDGADIPRIVRSIYRKEEVRKKGPAWPSQT